MARLCGWAIRTNEAYLAALTDAVSPLTKIVGAHSHGHWPGAMHDDFLGVRKQLNADCFLQLCEDDVFGVAPAAGSWQDKLQDCFAT